MKVAGAVFDFDSTLSHFIGGKEGLYKIFVSRGIPDDVVRNAYEEVKKDGGFTIDRLIGNIEERAYRRFEVNSIQVEFITWLNAAVALYSDTLVLISKLKELHIPVIIVTYGDEIFQKQKVMSSSVPYDELYIVNEEKGKAKILQQLLVRYGKPLFFIDDKPLALDLVRDSGLGESEVITIRIRRADSSHFHEKPRFQHNEIFSLLEMEDLLTFSVTK